MSAPAEPFIAHETAADLPDVRRARALWRNPGVVFGVAVLLIIRLLAIGAAYLANVDPILLRPRFRLRAPSAIAWLGTDQFGRDVYSRVLFGARVSLFIGFAVATIAVVAGLIIGLVAG